MEGTELSQLSREDDTISIGGALKTDDLERKDRSTKLLADELHDEKKLSNLLVSAYVRRQELRWSDVRLDISALYRPDSFPRGSVEPHRWIWHRSHSCPLQGGDHVNVLELPALVHTFERRLRNHTSFWELSRPALHGLSSGISSCHVAPLQFQVAEPPPAKVCCSTSGWRRMAIAGLCRNREEPGRRA